MYQILNTLYITTPNAYAHLENDTLRIDVERQKKLQVPLHHLGAVVCFGNVMISPALMHRCADEGIGLVLLDTNGRFKARLEGAVSGNILLRLAQHRKAAEEPFALAIAKAAIAGKLCNGRQVGKPRILSEAYKKISQSTATAMKTFMSWKRYFLQTSKRNYGLFFCQSQIRD